MRGIRALALAGAMLWAGSAQAATFVQSFSVDNRNPGFLETFDTSLGQLNSVSIEGSLGVSLTLFVGVPYPVTGTATVTGGGGVLPLGVGGSFTTSTLFASDGFSFAGLGGSASFSKKLDRGVDDLSLFFGSEPIALTFGGGASIVSIVDDQGKPIPYELLAGGSGGASGTVTYTYGDLSDTDPGTEPVLAPVPEPATWAMMIAGFGLVGGALRRQRVALKSASAL